MMSPGIAKELQVVAVALVQGAMITFVYDVIRIFRRLISHGNLWIAVEDGLFWIWTSLRIFSVLYRENDGSFRMYTILTMTAGMLLYHNTIGEPFVKFMGIFLRKLFGILGYPLKKIKIYISFMENKLKNWICRIIIKVNH